MMGPSGELKSRWPTHIPKIIDDAQGFAVPDNWNRADAGFRVVELVRTDRCNRECISGNQISSGV